MNCQKCGADNQDDSLFCRKCGNKLTLSDTQTNPVSNTENIQEKADNKQLSFWRKIPGYRSKTPWKMILATIIYSWIIAIILMPLISSKQPVGSQKENAANLYQQADLYFNNKHYDQAKELYNKIIQDYPYSNEAKKAQDKLSNIDDLIKQNEAAKAEEEKRKAEEEAAKQKAYEESIKPPLQLVEADVTLNAISNPQARVIVKNISNKTIDAYTVGIYCYDRFGNGVKHYAYGTNRYGGLSQHTVEPGQTIGKNYYWTLYGHENTAKIEVVLEKVHFTDGSTWIPQSGQRVSIKGALEQ